MKKKKIHDQDIADTDIEITTESVYEQLGYKNHEEMEAKAILVMEIGSAIKKKKLTQVMAAKILKITQPKLSALLNGHFRGYSVERLIHFLTELGKDIDIIIRPKQHRKARINIYPSNTIDYSNIPLAAKEK